MTEHGENEPMTWWCKQRDGRIVEHQASAYDGHTGHLQCVLVEFLFEGQET